jgi:type IV pilus assembly protein PilC
MVKVGEESGRLSEMLARVGKLYEDRVDVYVSRLSTLIEPLVMVFVGSIIGILVVAMFMPILNLSSAIHA